MTKSPEIFDPYLGKMWGNILDQYDNPTYNLKLYMKPETDAAATGTSPSSTTGQPASNSGDPRSDTPTAGSTTTKVTDKKIVVLAQTGVTASQIDDLELECYADASKTTAGVKTLTATFTIVQPGAANFLDQIQYARKYLGASDDKLSSPDFYLYLDITFNGYSSDPDDNEERGEPVQIIDTVTYKLKVLNIGVKIDNTGSRYNFETSISSTGEAFAPTIFQLRQLMEIRGKTITEAFKDFESQFNLILAKQSTEYVPDQISFNLAPLLKGSGTSTSTTGNKLNGEFIKDQQLITPAGNEKVEVRVEPAFDKPPETAKEQRLDADGSANVGKGTEKRLPELKISLSEGQTIFDVVGTILLNNKEFQSYVTRKVNLDNPGNKEVDVQKVYITWYDIHCEIQNVKWDKKRNRYAKKFIYTPYLVSDARSDISLTSDELTHLTDTETVSGSDKKIPIAGAATKRLQTLYNDRALSKSYFYIFTGLNDQIINLDINLDNALTILMPPKGGMIGDFSVTSSNALQNSAPRTADMTLGDKLEAAKKAQDKASLVDIFKQIRGAANNINALAQSLGRSVEQINDAIRNPTQAVALANSLDGATINSTLRKIGSSDGSDPAAVPGPVTEISKTNLSGGYSPEISGFLYSDDFVQPGGNITKDEFEAAGLIELDSKVPTNIGYAEPYTRSLPSPLSGVASDGPASVLMGYVYRARKATSFLLDITLTLRGDPYWLTKINTGAYDDKAKPSRDSTQNPIPGKKYYFLLTIGSPSRYDFNVDDEDDNTGYWSDGRTSGVFSGLYYPIEWKNKFSNGIFTTEIVAVKEISVPLQWIRRTALGEKPTDWDAMGITNEVQDDLLVSTRRTTVAPETNPNVNSNPTSPVRGDLPVALANPLGNANYRVGDGLGAGRNHGGVDLLAPAGTPIYTAAPGTVVRSEFSQSYGYVVYIDHGNGVQTRYGHMQSQSPLRVGETVASGQRIGGVGTTGRSTANHLHFEVRTGNSSSRDNGATTPVDAKQYLGRGG